MTLNLITFEIGGKVFPPLVPLPFIFVDIFVDIFFLLERIIGRHGNLGMRVTY